MKDTLMFTPVTPTKPRNPMNLTVVIVVITAALLALGLTIATTEKRTTTQTEEAPLIGEQLEGCQITPLAITPATWEQGGLNGTRVLRSSGVFIDGNEFKAIRFTADGVGEMVAVFYVGDPRVHPYPINREASLYSGIKVAVPMRGMNEKYGRQAKSCVD